MYNDPIRRAGQRQASCGCNDQPAIRVEAGLRKNAMGRENWKVTFRNDEPFPVFLTLATAECVAGNKDWDTIQRDIEIQPRSSQTIEFPAHGNGAEKNADYRITVRNKCDTVIGTVEGELKARCG